MNEEQSIERLKEDVLQKMGHTLDSPTDFDYLALQVKNVTGEDISSTTLKRLFGYIPSQGSTRKSSLSILARYLGFTGWSSYTDSTHVNSGFISKKVVMADKLSEGNMIEVAWAPDREVTFVALGESRFAVTKSVNSQLVVGDIAEVVMFIINQPLQVRNVIHEGKNMGPYSAGLNGGLIKLNIKK